MTVLKLVTTCGLATVLLFKVALHSQRMSYFYSVSYEPMDGSYIGACTKSSNYSALHNRSQLSSFNYFFVEI